METTEYRAKLSRLERRAETVTQAFNPDPPDEERAIELLREGVGPTVSIYCTARTGDSWTRFEPAEFERLEATLNQWLSLYGACYGVELHGTYSIRTAAQLLVDTHNIRDVARALTGVPEDYP